MEDMIGRQIGRGGTSTVYEWGKDKVIKVYKPHVTDATIQAEEYIVNILNTCNLDIPKYINTIEFNGKKALIFERLKGRALFEFIMESPDDPKIAYKFAKMHHEIHNRSINVLPSHNDFLKQRIIELSSILGEKVADKLLDILNSIPTKNMLLHGDYQPLNIIVESNRYIAIDWNGASLGNPLLDVAWSCMTLSSPAISHLLDDKKADIVHRFKNEYLSNYCKIAKVSEDEILRCLPIVAVRRLYDNNMCDNDISRQEYKWLHELINQERVDI
ncbi:phosphotransferase [Mobilitalea sibirica]|uniref:Phosphotransferase n=1 Tax=Mobilitalea sibirica TaxID=1462919 RepID=A0A8J7KVX6_9FIRM|nr:aminoglycoside phosphotransferase family protein [Mobilitalea sibirica]MBH1939672.1 phosphotransferase [Mobilitalea sibirica]